MTEATLVRLLVFRVGSLVCAAEVDQVREILPRLPTTRIPGAPPVVAGLVNVRGRLVTVVEGWRALGQAAPARPAPADPAHPEEDATGPSGSTVILGLGGRPRTEEARLDTGEGDGVHLVGFTVDDVMDMLAVSPATLEDRSTGGLAGVDPRLVRAVGRRQGPDGSGAVVLVLNMDALLGPILYEGREQ
ncbi:MAG: chemotaxis protein CheW [Gemmatimonadales bacterium]